MPVAVSVPSGEPPRVSTSVKVCVAGIVRDRVVGAVARVDGGVRAVAAAQRVVAGAAGENVVAAMAPQRVVAAEAGKRVAEVATGQRLADVGAGAIDGRVRHAAVHDVACTGIGAIRVGVPGSDEQIVEAVEIDVARGSNGHACAARRDVAGDGKAVGPVERGKQNIGRKARGHAEHHIGHAGTLGVGLWSPEYQVVEAVAVDVAGRGDGAANAVLHGHAADAKAVGSVERGEFRYGGKARRFAEDYVTGAGTKNAIRARLVGADEHVGEAISVDVAGRGDGDSGAVEVFLTVDLEAVSAVD